MEMTFEFVVPKSRLDLRKNVLLRHFLRRKNYTISPNHAKYFNAETGISFKFSFKMPESKEDTKDYIYAGVNFSIPQTRAHIFILEANIELHAFVTRFGLLVEQQKNTLEGEPYSDKWFSNTWNNWNASLATTQSKKTAENVEAAKIIPSQKMEDVWWWNYNRCLLEADYFGKYQVPSIFYFNTMGSIHTAAVWNSDQPLAIPEVDYLLCRKQEKDHMGRKTSRRAQVILVEFDSISQIIPPKEISKPDTTTHYIIEGEGIERHLPYQGIAVEHLGLPFIGNVKQIQTDELSDKQTWQWLDNQNKNAAGS